MPDKPNLVIDAFVRRFLDQKQMVEKAIAQLPDELLHQPLDANTNSVTVIMKHMGGNLRSRFADFLASDGEKPSRDRDSEFIDDIPDRAELLALWERGWACLIQSLNALADVDLEKIVTIRGQPHTVADALARALAHMAYHTGQIVQLARFLAKDHWTTLTLPRGGTKQFNQTMQQRFGKP